MDASVNDQIQTRVRMPRETLDRQIQHLKDEVLLLGSMVEQATLEAIDALQRQDTAAAKKIFAGDHLINEKRYAIENAILILIATQQPMARDLRIMAAILEVITELERMGDYAKGIAKITRQLGDASLPISLRDYSTLGDEVVSLLHRTLSAFSAEDAQEAYHIPTEVDQVDVMNITIQQNLAAALIANPDGIEYINLLSWVNHNIERMADRVTNICERTVFICTGELIEMDSDDEETD